MNYIVLYLSLINAVAIILCVSDKQRAKQKRMRISEKSLFAISIIGGSVGMYIAMYLMRHKTSRLHFVIGIPVIIVVQAVILLYVFGTQG